MTHGTGGRGEGGRGYLDLSAPALVVRDRATGRIVCRYGPGADRGREPEPVRRDPGRGGTLGR